MSSLKGAERNARDDNFMAHFYEMLDLQLQIGGRPATPKERDNLNECFPLNAHVQCLVGLGEGQRFPEEEDVNTLECLEAESEQSEEEAEDDVDGEEDDEDWTAANGAFYDEGESGAFYDEEPYMH
ncbi:hypothetical protein A4A49_06774 [Nicotiana attenuata]|uniref:Uncharacterized protein n=1 Tax=Nicotiana attenuata TaxID=49451 RepID=A0A314LAK9_NICAT|nr:hypothetical protein A4A49_06774 [Nicotiana attenuata]